MTLCYPKWPLQEVPQDYPEPMESRNYASTPNGHSPETEIIRRKLAHAVAHFSMPIYRLPRHPTDPTIERLEYIKEMLEAVLNSYESRIGQALRQRIARRLSVLLDPDTWDVTSSTPEPRSFVLMLEFLSDNPQFRPPSIFLTASGYFDVSWRKSRDRLASIVFLPNGKVSWLVFAPDPDDTESPEEAAGTTGRESIVNRLKRYGALDWMMNE